MLAWSYPLGYYMDPNAPQSELFATMHQANLEQYTDHLQELAEQPLEAFRDNEKRQDGKNVILLQHNLFT